MKKTKKSTNLEPDEMQPEYNLIGRYGVRRKYYHAYRQEFKVKIYQEDGRVSIYQFNS